MLGSVLVELDVDLAGAEDDAVDLVRGSDVVGLVGGVRDDPLEVGVAGEVGEGGAGEGVAEQGFGEEEDECWWRGLVVVFVKRRGVGVYVF